MQRGAFYQPYSVELFDDALHLCSPKFQSQIVWSAIREAKRSDDHVFFFMTKRLAYIVPRRAFDSDAQFEAFAGAAQERWEVRNRL
ncbi:MAG TPA: YcxB family protein [Sphingomicrobium sp.]